MFKIRSLKRFCSIFILLAFVFSSFSALITCSAQSQIDPNQVGEHTLEFRYHRIYSAMVADPSKMLYSFGIARSSSTYWTAMHSKLAGEPNKGYINGMRYACTGYIFGDYWDADKYDLTCLRWDGRWADLDYYTYYAQFPSTIEYKSSDYLGSHPTNVLVDEKITKTEITPSSPTLYYTVAVATFETNFWTQELEMNYHDHVTFGLYYPFKKGAINNWLILDKKDPGMSVRHYVKYRIENSQPIVSGILERYDSIQINTYEPEGDSHVVEVDWNYNSSTFDVDWSSECVGSPSKYRETYIPWNNVPRARGPIIAVRARDYFSYIGFENDYNLKQYMLIRVSSGAGGSPAPVVLIEIPPGVNTHITEIDVKPGCLNNTTNPNSNGILPVAVISTDSLNVSSIDLDTVEFGNGSAEPVHVKVRDVDRDGDDDLYLHFRTEDIDIEDPWIEFVSETAEGDIVVGVGEARLVPPEDPPEPPTKETGKENAPGQLKEKGDPANGKAKGKND